MESTTSVQGLNPASSCKSTTHSLGEGSNASLAIGKKFKTFQSVNNVIKTFCDENFQPFRIKRSVVFDHSSKYYHYKSVIFSCVHSGVSRQRGKGIRHRRSISHTGCPAVIKVRLYDKPCMHYKIYYLNLDHNHEISTEEYSIYSKEHCLSKEERAFVFEILASNATNKDIKLFIQDIMNKKPSSRDVINLRAQFKKSLSGTIENRKHLTYCKEIFAEKWNKLQKENNKPDFSKIYKQLDDLYFRRSNVKRIFEQSKGESIRKKVFDRSILCNDATTDSVDSLPLQAVSPKRTSKNNLGGMNISQKYMYSKIYTDKLATLLSQCNNQELETKLNFLSSLIVAWKCKEHVLLSKNRNGTLEIYSENENHPSEESNINDSELNAEIDVASSPVQSDLPTSETDLPQDVPLVESSKTFSSDDCSDVSEESADVTEFEENSPCKEPQAHSTEEFSDFGTSTSDNTLPCGENSDSSAAIEQSEDTNNLLNQIQEKESTRKIVISSENILFPKAMKEAHISPMVLTPCALQNMYPSYRIRRLFKKILPRSEADPSQSLEESYNSTEMSNDARTGTTLLRTNSSSASRKRTRRSKLVKLALPSKVRKILPKLVPPTQVTITEVSSSVQEQNDMSTNKIISLPQSVEPSENLDKSKECIDNSRISTADNVTASTRSFSSEGLQTSKEQIPNNLKESQSLPLTVNQNLLPEPVPVVRAETTAGSSNQILDSLLATEKDTLSDPVPLAEPLKSDQKLPKSQNSNHKNVLDSSSDVGKRTKRVYCKRLNSSRKPFTLPDLSKNVLNISLFKDKIAELRTSTMRKKLENLINNLSDTDIEDILSDRMLNDKIINVGQILIHLKFPEACGLQDVLLGSTLSFKAVTSKFVQVIYCEKSNHWITISTLSSPPDTVYVYNSLDEPVPRDAIPQICNIINPQSSSLTIISQPMQITSNKVDCGLFALASAITLLNEKDPSESIYDVSAFRQHLMSGVIKNDLQEFPTLSNGTVKKSVKRTEIFQLLFM